MTRTGTSDPLAARIVAAVRAVARDHAPPLALHAPEFAGNDWAYVKACLDTGWVSSVGAFVDRFEADLAALCGSARAIATVNGTAALHMCLLLAGVSAGDEVLVPAVTFVATANAVAYTGATPHFVDSETVSLGIDAQRLHAYLARIARIENGRCVNRQSGACIRALVVMHVLGHPCDLDALAAVARDWHLALVEDAAESLGSSYKERHTGNTGLCAALSFNGNKVVTTGGGGAILTNDEALGRTAKHLTTTARVADRWHFLHDAVGYNYRLPNLNAALGCAQLEQLPRMLAEKRLLAARYREAFASVAGVTFIDEPAGTHSNFWLNSIRLDNGTPALLAEVLAALNDAGYMARPLWTLMHQLPMYQSCPRDALPVAEQLAACVINLPSSPVLAR